MRVFVGVVPPPEISARIVDAAKEISALSKGELHVPRSEPHITLKAPQLADSPEEAISRVRLIAASTKRFQVTVKEPAFFRNKYMALRIVSNELQVLHEAFATGLAEFNSGEIERIEGRDFDPHISIAKANSPISNTRPFLDLAKKIFDQNLMFEVREVVVFGLNEAENTYFHLIEIPLRG